jgi:transcriptional regulator with PAS, ATPase and Fis domain
MVRESLTRNLRHRHERDAASQRFNEKGCTMVMAPPLLHHTPRLISGEVAMSMVDDVNALALAGTRIWVRRRDRRADLRQVLGALALRLAEPLADRTLQSVFERELTHILPARSVRLREIPTRFQARLVTPTRTAQSVVLDVPTRDSSRQIVLEATMAPGSRLDDWNRDLLVAAANLGGLVMELDLRRPPMPAAAREEGSPMLVGSTPPMCQLRERVERVAKTDFTVLIEGESGTGKELVARQIHELSWRRRGPFVAVNCAALVETLFEAELFGIEDRTATGVRGRRGKFEHADGGTLFLDEISDLSLSAQAKFLRAIQDMSVERVGGHGVRRVDVRIVAASNRALGGLVSKGLFRADLFYRLSGVEVHVPALRSRPDDVLELARYFLSRHRDGARLTVSDAAADALQLYSWPGNVRELERLIERAITLVATEQIELDDLPTEVRGQYNDVFGPSLESGDTMRAWGSRYARMVFERCGKNKRKASRALGISYHTLEGYLRYAQQRRHGGRKAMPSWVTGSYPRQEPSHDGN